MKEGCLQGAEAGGSQKNKCSDLILTLQSPANFSHLPNAIKSQRASIYMGQFIYVSISGYKAE